MSKKKSIWKSKYKTAYQNLCLSHEALDSIKGLSPKMRKVEKKIFKTIQVFEKTYYGASYIIGK